MTDDRSAASVDVEAPTVINDDRDPVDVAADEFAARYRNGEYPSVTEYVQRFPDQAEELKELLPAVAMMEQLKQKEESRIDSIERQSVISGLQQLGDFRIIREIGHGGMGVVYEAEQESLGRHVALKVLSPATFDSPKSIRRFRREAETVARLHHTNIVPVFGVGDEKGLHYYVMQLIEGEPLNDVVTGLRSKTEGGNGDHNSAVTGPAGATGSASAESPAGSDRKSTGKASGTHSLPAASAVRLTNSANGDSPAPDFHIESSVEMQLAADSDDEFAETVMQSSEDLAQLSEPNLADTVDQVKTRKPAEEPTSESDDSDAGNRPPHETLLPATERLSALLQTGEYWNAVAEIGIQVSRALVYAHGHGVWHRDIKPSNLLIDRSGTVWLVDFGLARIAEDNELTQTGDLLGTLRYMSPEQVVGEFDHRSDVYSLGLTLYELLTFRPAHDASIRSRIVEQISAASPKSPRLINPAIPKDLETIVLKATAHGPGDRYQSANELAEDLQRFSQGFPIKARRFSAAEQLLRWSRRNPALAWTTATTAILLVTVAAVSVWGFVTTRDANRDLTEERGRTRIEAERAEDNLKMALLAFEEIVDGISQRGIPQSVQSDLNLDIETEDGETSQPVANLTPAVTEADAELLKRLLKFYIDFAGRNESSPEVAAQTAKAQRRVGDIYQRLGRHEEAIAAYENARSQYQILSLAELEPSLADILARPDVPVSYNATLAVAEISGQIGEAAALVGDLGTTRESYESAVNYLASLPAEVQSRPETRFATAQTKTAFASLPNRFAGRMGGFDPKRFGGGGPGGSRDSRRPPGDSRSRGGRDDDRGGDRGGAPRSRDGGSRGGGARELVASDRGPNGRPERGGPAESRQGRQPPGGERGGFGPPGGGPGRGYGPPQGIEEFMETTRQEARVLLERLIEEDAQHPDYQLELAKLLLTSASSRSRSRSRDSVNPMSDLDQAIGILEELATGHPGNPNYQFQLADALALASPETKRFETPEQAAARCSRSIEIARKLQQQFPNAPEYDILLANSLRRLSGVQNDQNQLSDSQASVDEAVSILRRLTEVWPGHVIYRLSLAQALMHSAMLERRLKAGGVSLQRLDEAVALFSDVESFDDQPVFVPAILSMIHRNRGEFLIRTGREAEAKEAWALATKLAPWMSKGPGGPRPDDRDYGRPGGSERYPQHQKPKGPPRDRPNNGRPDRPPGDENSTETDRQKRDRPPAE
ncbi:MAG: serine/threonine protein kinase/predicted negative regulator of RcsB-dependent stress response [Planctomycetaceae bacterium]